jgi:hypothetical protein
MPACSLRPCVVVWHISHYTLTHQATTHSCTPHNTLTHAHARTKEQPCQPASINGCSAVHA